MEETKTMLMSEIYLTPTQVKIVNALKDGPKTKFQLEEVLEKDIFGSSESLIKTQICLINGKDKNNKLIEGFKDQTDGEYKYRLTKESPKVKAMEKLEEIDEKQELIHILLEDNKEMNKMIANMSMRQYVLTLIVLGAICMTVGGLVYKAYWNSQFYIINNDEWQEKK